MSIHNRNSHVPLTPEDLTEVDDQISALWEVLMLLPEVDPKLLRRVVKIGAKSETFARRTLDVAVQNEDLLPRGLDVDAVRSMQTLRDSLQKRAMRLQALSIRLNSIVKLLGSDIYSATLAAYRSMKANNRDAALVETLNELARNFSRSKRREEEEVPPAVAAPSVTQSAASPVLQATETAPVRRGSRARKAPAGQVPPKRSAPPAAAPAAPRQYARPVAGQISTAVIGHLPPSTPPSNKSSTVRTRRKRATTAESPAGAVMQAG